jgi:hypothetical protein
LIELNGDDLRRDPLEGRKTTLKMMLVKASPGIRFNEHMKGDGETVFRHACKLGLEGMFRGGGCYTRPCQLSERRHRHSPESLVYLSQIFSPSEMAESFDPVIAGIDFRESAVPCR